MTWSSSKRTFSRVLAERLGLAGQGGDFAAACGVAPGRARRAPLCGGRDGAEALGEAQAPVPGEPGQSAVPGGEEAFIALRPPELLGAERGLADRLGGLADRAGGGKRGDEDALHLRVPTVGAGLAARDGLELEQVGISGERILAGGALGAAAVAEQGDGAVHGHDSSRSGDWWRARSEVAVTN